MSERFLVIPEHVLRPDHAEIVLPEEFEEFGFVKMRLDTLDAVGFLTEEGRRLPREQRRAMEDDVVFRHSRQFTEHLRVLPDMHHRCAAEYDIEGFVGIGKPSRIFDVEGDVGI